MNIANSLRVRLTLVFLGLTVGSLLIVGCVFILGNYRAQTRGAIVLQREMAAHLSSRVQSLIGDLERGVQMLIRIEDLGKITPERRTLILATFHAHQSSIADLMLLDGNGQILSYHSRLKPNLNVPPPANKDLEALTVPMSRGETYFGPVRFVERSGEPLMTMAVPLIDLHTGTPEGVLAADVRLKEIWDLVAKIRPGQQGASFIVDSHHRVVAHTNPSVVLRGTHFDVPDFNGIQMGLSGEKSVMVSRVLGIGDQQFYIVVEGPVSEILAPAIHTAGVMLTIVVIALLASSTLGFLAAQWIARPIENIAESARAVMAGDLSRRVVVKSRDEVGVLADAFNNMTMQLESLIGDLEKRVAERTTELEASNQELEAFAYSVSHDLRAPLRHIDGFMKLLQQRTSAALDEQSRHYMDTIADAAKRMGMLIDDLLAFSRMGRSDMAARSIDLASVVQEVIRELEPETRGRAIHWQIADLPVVTGDRAMLRVVLVNLIANAVKFTRLRERTEIEIGCQPGHGDEVVVFVRDNGVGFDMLYVDKLFGVFQRLHRVEDFEGTGIGLANVRRIVARHGGRTWAEGAVGQGATLYVALPSQ